MMGFFLMEQDAAEASEWRPALDQPFFDSPQNRLAEPLENHLFG